MKKLLNEVVSGRSLSSEDAEAAMSQIMAGEATSAQIAGLLVALRLKGETVDEIAGFARAMRSAATLLDLAGLSPPEVMQGRSFLPLLLGEQPTDWRRAM